MLRGTLVILAAFYACSCSRNSFPTSMRNGQLLHKVEKQDVTNLQQRQKLRSQKYIVQLYKTLSHGQRLPYGAQFVRSFPGIGKRNQYRTAMPICKHFTLYLKYIAKFNCSKHKRCDLRSNLTLIIVFYLYSFKAHTTITGIALDKSVNQIYRHSLLKYCILDHPSVLLFTYINNKTSLSVLVIHKTLDHKYSYINVCNLCSKVQLELNCEHCQLRKL